MKLTDAYILGAKLAFSKLSVSDTAITAGTAFLSPTASGLTAEDGKGLQTSLAGIAGSLLGKKVFKSDLAGRLLGSGAATAGSKVGAGLVSPDPVELQGMRDRGEFSAWDYGTRGLKTMGTSALIGGGLAAGGGIPAAAMGSLVAGGRGALSGFVVSPMVRGIMQNIENRQQDNNLDGSGKLLPAVMQHPVTTKALGYSNKLDHPLIEGALVGAMPIAQRMAKEQVDGMMTSQSGEE